MKVQRVGILIALLSSATFLWSQTIDRNATIRHIGTTTLSTDVSSPQSGLIGPSLEVDEKFDKPQITGSNQLARSSSAHVPTPAGSVVGSNPFTGFNGLTDLLQATAFSGPNGGQFILEPSDLGLAAGNGFVVETVNNAIAVYNPVTGQRIFREAMNYFFGLAPSVTVVNGVVTAYGPFLSDPRVFYDWQEHRFYVIELMIETDPATGDFGTHSSFLIAVSRTADPTGTWDVYSHDTSNDGDSRFGACPCFGDQPLMGFDANGIYVATNAFNITDGFRGGQLYAIGKQALLGNAGGSVDAVRIHDLNSAEGPAYSIQPATTPPGGTYESGNGGTEYFMSALHYSGNVDSRLAVWAMTNTSSLNSSADVHLQVKIIETQSYGVPPDMQQKDGPLPFRDLLWGALHLNNHLELVSSNDDRMQQVVYAAGKLWTGLTTVAKTPNGPVRSAAAWFIVTPSWSGSTLGASVAKQGYLALDSPDQNNVAYPSIGVNANGQGAVSVTVIGQSYYPSTAIAPISVDGVGSLTITGPGPVPDDGFSGYAPYGSRSGRWGDYSAAGADEDGNIWMANINTNTLRTTYANWSTFITKYTPQ